MAPFIAGVQGTVMCKLGWCIMRHVAAWVLTSSLFPASVLKLVISLESYIKLQRKYNMHCFVELALHHSVCVLHRKQHSETTAKELLTIWASDLSDCVSSCRQVLMLDWFL